MRAVFRRLPRTALSYKLAKALTRTMLRPARTPFVLDVTLGHGATLRVDLADIVGNDLFCMDDHYEGPSLRLWRALARDARIVLDLGSHGGLFACAAATANPKAQVFAIEAWEPNVAYLRRNAARHPNVTPVATAIAATTGPVTFRRSPITGGGFVEAHSLARGGVTEGMRDQTAERVVVEAVALADLCARYALPHVDLMKLDLEGLEYPLLTGQADFWARWAPAHLLIEIARPRRTAADPLFAAMAARGYRWRRIERLFTVPWGRADELANWHFWHPPAAR